MDRVSRKGGKRVVIIIIIKDGLGREEGVIYIYIYIAWTATALPYNNFAPYPLVNFVCHFNETDTNKGCAAFL